MDRAIQTRQLSDPFYRLEGIKQKMDPLYKEASDKYNIKRLSRISPLLEPEPEPESVEEGDFVTSSGFGKLNDLQPEPEPEPFRGGKKSNKKTLKKR